MVNMNKKTGNWFKDNMFNIITATLLGIIAYGGKQFIDTQLDFQKSQRSINQELMKTNATNTQKCIIINEKISTNSDVNMEQGNVLMRHSETLVKHDAEINYLKRE